MIYCVNYSKDFRYMDEINEVILNHYSGSDALMEFVPTLVKDNKSKKRIIVNLLEVNKDKITEPIIYIAKLIQDGYNMTAMIPEDEDIIKECKEDNVPFFFQKFATNIETAYTMAERGVSDVYVAEELGFRIKDLQYIRFNYNIKLRVFPNIAQSAKNSVVDPMQRFWIRPEDTELYEDYVDVFELLSGEDTSRLSVVYEIYRQRQWLGNLNDLILDFSGPIIPNTGIEPNFGPSRVNCNKRCCIGRCNICPEIAKLADGFNKADIQIVRKQYHPVTELSEKEKEEILNGYRKRQEQLGTTETFDDI